MAGQAKAKEVAEREVAKLQKMLRELGHVDAEGALHLQTMDEVREYAGANQSIGEMPRVEVLDSLTDTIEELCGLVDDAWCALLPPLPTSAQHSPALVCAGGRAAWRLRPLAGTTGTSSRLEGARSTWGCALRAALDVICLVHVCKMRTICAARARRRLGRDKPLTSRCSVQRVAVRRGGDLALALGEPYVRGCRGSGDLKAWWWADPRLRAI